MAEAAPAGFEPALDDRLRSLGAHLRRPADPSNDLLTIGPESFWTENLSPAEFARSARGLLLRSFLLTVPPNRFCWVSARSADTGEKGGPATLFFTRPLDIRGPPAIATTTPGAAGLLLSEAGRYLFQVQ